MSGLDLPGLAAAAASSKRQAASSNPREMGKNQTSVVVLQIQLKFWWMIPKGVKYNHTKLEQETQRWRRGTGFASGGPQFQKMQLCDLFVAGERTGETGQTTGDYQTTVVTTKVRQTVDEIHVQQRVSTVGEADWRPVPGHVSRSVCRRDSHRSPLWAAYERVVQRRLVGSRNAP